MPAMPRPKKASKLIQKILGTQVPADTKVNQVDAKKDFVSEIGGRRDIANDLQKNIKR